MVSLKCYVELSNAFSSFNNTDKSSNEKKSGKTMYFINHDKVDC